MNDIPASSWAKAPSLDDIAAIAEAAITKDAMYDAVAPDDFESMLELDRYNNRSTAFDKIISATHDHFWDPLDKTYTSTSDEPFDMENQALVPEDLVIALSTDYVSNHLSDPKSASASSTSRCCAASRRSCTASRAR
jgi:hypothetical protein